jgi:hypothetical protein
MVENRQILRPPRATAAPRRADQAPSPEAGCRPCVRVGVKPSLAEPDDEQGTGHVWIEEGDGDHVFLRLHQRFNNAIDRRAARDGTRDLGNDERAQMRLGMMTAVGDERFSGLPGDHQQLRRTAIRKEINVLTIELTSESRTYNRKPNLQSKADHGAAREAAFSDHSGTRFRRKCCPAPASRGCGTAEHACQGCC